MGDWCKAELTKVLETARGSAEQVQISITKVKSVEGTASVVASRGQVRHIYEYALELEWKAKRLAELPPPGVPPAVDAKVIETKLCSGTLHYAEVSPTATPGTVSGAGSADATHTYKAEFKEPELRPAAAAALEAKKARTEAAVALAADRARQPPVERLSVAQQLKDRHANMLAQLIAHRGTGSAGPAMGPGSRPSSTSLISTGLSTSTSRERK
jgi:hypothetical protein